MELTAKLMKSDPAQTVAALVADWNWMRIGLELEVKTK